MKYFAYGSNMSLARLQARVPNVRPLGRHTLAGHALRFHKAGDDGSAKCDACPTSNDADRVWGVLFEVDANGKATLDRIEGAGYAVAEVSVIDEDGRRQTAFTYRAVRIDAARKPFTWYLHHVLVGAREAGLPRAYIEGIAAVDSIDDPDPARHAREHGVHG